MSVESENTDFANQEANKDQLPSLSELGMHVQPEIEGDHNYDEITNFDQNYEQNERAYDLGTIDSDETPRDVTPEELQMIAEKRAERAKAGGEVIEAASNGVVVSELPAEQGEQAPVAPAIQEQEA